MSYIEREKTIEFVLNNVPHINGETTLKCVERALKESPTADVIEVVRCKECRHQDGCNQYVLISGDEGELAFCSYGERKEE